MSAGNGDARSPEAMDVWLTRATDSLVEDARASGHNTPDVHVASMLYRQIVRLVGDINSVAAAQKRKRAPRLKK